MTSRPDVERPEGDVRHAASPPDGHAGATTPADARQVERFADAWAAVADGAALADVLAAVADDAELVALVRLAAGAAAVLPATVAQATRARQLAALQAVRPAGHRRGAAALGATVTGTVPDAGAPAGARERAKRSGRPPSGEAVRGGWLRRWGVVRPQLVLRLSAVAVAVALGLGSSVVASADDLPGDTLYGVKRAAETARMALIFDPARRAAFHLQLAELRISEIRTLINRGRNPSAWVVEALIAQLTSAASDADVARDGMLVAQVRSARVAAARSLGELAERLPDDAATVLQDGAAVLAPPPPSAAPPAGRAPAHGERSIPTPTARAAAATPTSVLPDGGGAEPRSGAAAQPPTARPPFAAPPTAAAPTRPAGDLAGSGGTSGSGGGAPIPPGGAVQAPTNAPPPQATDAPPPEPTTEANPFGDARATALSTQPPHATKVPTKVRERP